MLGSVRVFSRRLMTSSSAFGRSFHSTSSLLGKVEFKLADIGEGIAEVEVLQWYVEPGATVKQFDKICEVQSDKATVDITSRYDGVVQSLKWEVGEMATVGSTLVELEVDGQSSETSSEPEAKEEEAKIVEAKTEEIVGISRPPPSLKRAGSFSVEPVLRPTTEGSYEENVPSTGNFDSTERTLSTPAVRRLAKDHNLDLNLIQGTGKGGRILKGDVLAYVANVPIQQRKPAVVDNTPSSPSQQSQQQSSSPPEQEIKHFEQLQEDVVVPVKGIQRIMVKSMEESLKIPHFNYMEEYDMSEMVKFRSELRDISSGRGLKLSYMPILIKATSLSLVQYPSLNAHVSSDVSQVVQKASHNIGVAMDTPRGLLVPVIKDVQQKSIFDIAKDLVCLQELGNNNKLGENELTGGTFTLSNIGAIGGTYASPVIPSPTVAIGALGKIQTIPRFDKDQNVYPAHMMNISWAADHRVVDGATIARFSNQLKQYIENPLSLVSDMK